MKPILFNTEMVKAILDGRKTVTRRILKSLPSDAEFAGWLLDSTLQEDTKDIGKAGFKTSEPTEKCGCVFVKPPYQARDILYVRETWCKNGSAYLYKAGCPRLQNNMWIKWRPSIHMPKVAARIFLKVKEVRVEKLQDMCVADCVREGADTGVSWVIDAKPNFIKLWDSTVKKSDIDRYGWDANPWVWVIEFEQIPEYKAILEEL